MTEIFIEGNLHICFMNDEYSWIMGSGVASWQFSKEGRYKKKLQLILAVNSIATVQHHLPQHHTS